MTTMTESRIQELRHTVYVIDELRTLSRAVHTQDENACNGDLTPRQTTRKARLLARATELAESLGCVLYHQSDPRGCSLYLIDESMDGSTYNNGIALY